MKAILCAFVVLGALEAAAQPNSVVPKNIRAANTLETLFDYNGLSTTDNLWGIPLEPGRVLGTTYLTDEWNRTTIMLYDTERLIEGYNTRYEIYLNQIEIKTTEDIKVLDGQRVRSFVWVDNVSQSAHYFVNARDYEVEDDSQVTGFFEVLSEGPVTLLSRTTIYVKEPTYNVAFDMGNRDTKVVKKAIFYYLDGATVRQLPTSKKRLLSIFPVGGDVIDDFIKTNQLSLKDAIHLQILFDHYNQHIATN